MKVSKEELKELIKLYSGMDKLSRAIWLGSGSVLLGKEMTEKEQMMVKPQKTAQEERMQKDFNRLRTGFVGVCAALALMQGCVNDVKYIRLHQEYQRHLKAEAEFLQDLVLILQNGHLDSAQIVSKFEKEIQRQILNIGHHSDPGKMKFRSL